MKHFCMLLLLLLTARLGAAQSVWSGASNTSWTTAANWSGGVPSATRSATIPVISSGRYPIVAVSTTATCMALTINAGASLTVNGRLTVYGASSTAGSLVIGAVGTTGLRTVTTRNSVTVTNTGTLAINGTLEASGNFNVANNGTITSSDASQVTFSNSSPITFSGSGTTSLSSIKFSYTPNATVTFTTSKPVDVRRALVLEAANVTSNGKIRLTSDATSTGMIYNEGVGGGIITDNIVAQRYIDPRYNRASGYRHYSTPVNGATFDMFESGTNFVAQCNAAYSYPTNRQVTPFPTVFYYNESLVPTSTTDPSPFDFGWRSVASKTTTMEAARGYTVHIDAVNTSATPNQPNTISLTGVPQTGNYSSPAYGKQGNGFSLVGNPYPGFIDMNLVMSDNLDNTNHQGFDGVVYKYQSLGAYNGTYRALYLDSTGTDSLNQYFPMMQGFFVRKSDNVGTAQYQFNNDQRLGPDYPLTNTTPFYRTARPTSVQGIYLSIRNNADARLEDEIRVEFRPGATGGHDARYDAVRPADNVGQVPTLYSVSAVGEQCLRNGLPPLSRSTLVPLGLRTLVPGQRYTLYPTKLLGLQAGQVLLEDRLSGRVQDLALYPDYTFTAQATAYEQRFFLRFAPTGGSLATMSEAANLVVYPMPGKIGQDIAFSMDGLQAGVATTSLLTPFGKAVATTQCNISESSLGQGALSTVELKPGIYVLRVVSAGKVLTKQIELR